MKKVLLGIAMGSAICLAPFLTAQADDSQETIPDGVTIGTVDVSGMTQDEAEKAVQTYVDQVSQANVTLTGQGDEDTVTLTAADMGLTWANTGVVKEAANIGEVGNVVERYKLLKDAAHGGVTYDLKYSFDDKTLTSVFEDKCAAFNVKAKDYSLSLVNGSFQIEDGTTGYAIDEDASADAIQTYVKDSWDGKDCSIPLVVNVTEPKGSKEELESVGDVLGTYTTSYSSSGSERSGNIANGCSLASGITLYPGDEFSMLDHITPFTEENGYYLAGSYLNGQVVESFGGGICQVSTTLYNAVLRAELEVTERSNHSMIVTYVDPSEDAAIAENGGKNFKFVNNTDYPVYIDGATANKKITFTIYGKETRDPGRKVSFESETLEETTPNTDTFVTDASKPIGYVDVTQSAHKGIKAQLWKVVTVNGVEKSREVVNSSTYKMVPRIVSVGTAGADTNVAAQLNAAIATGSYDQVVATSNALAAVVAAGQTVDPNTGAAVAGNAASANPAAAASQVPATAGASNVAGAAATAAPSTGTVAGTPAPTTGTAAAGTAGTAAPTTGTASAATGTGAAVTNAG